MTSGTLTSFPITTVLELANETRSGICPIMESIVDPISLATHDATVSEHGIRLSLDDMLRNNIVYDNLDGGEPVFISLSSWHPSLSSSYANYRSLSALGPYLTGYVDNENIYLSGWYNEDIYNYSPGGTSRLPMQGGKYQFSRMFDNNDIVTMKTGGLPVGYAHANDMIGKIFIKSVGTPFTQSIQFSIGTATDDEKYVRKFTPPSTYGLADFNYNIYALSGGFVWIRSNTEDECETGIRIFSHYDGESFTTEKIGVSIFYDMADFSTEDGYFLRTSTSEDIYRFDFSTNTFSNRLTHPAYTAYEKTLTCVSDSGGKLYSAGGRTDAGSLFNRVETFSPDTDTNAGTVTQLNSARFGMGTFHDPNPSRMFFAGGSASMSTSAFVDAGSQTIEYYMVSDGTMNASVNMLTCSRYLPAGITDYDGTYGYVYGGFSNPAYSADDIKSSCDKYILSNDTVLSPVIELVARKFASNPFRYSSYVYFGPGYSFSSVYYILNTMIKMDTSNDTGTTVSSSYLTMKSAVSQSVQDNVHAYTCFGIRSSYDESYAVLSDYVLNRVEKMAFANETLTVIQPVVDSMLGLSPAGSA